MSVRQFDESDGHPVFEIGIRSPGGAEAKVLTWGAVVRDLIIPAPHGPQRVVLGLDTLADYRAHSPYFGAVVGRFANRIAGARFEIGHHRYVLDANEGTNTLHGGAASFGRRLWKLGAYDESSVQLTLHSPDGDGGYPGNLDITCTYRLTDSATLRIEMTGVTDAPTVINLAHHSYFNLDGSPDILGHELTLHADFYTPVDAGLIPTGEIRTVAGTNYDFRSPRQVGARGQSYDTNFVLSGLPAKTGGLAPAAHVRSPLNGVTMDMVTSEPAVQFYDGAGIVCPVPGLGGGRYGAHAGLCLEAQIYPDAPNRRHFPQSVLGPEQEYKQITEYRFA